MWQSRMSFSEVEWVQVRGNVRPGAFTIRERRIEAIPRAVALDVEGSVEVLNVSIRRDQQIQTRGVESCRQVRGLTICAM